MILLDTHAWFWLTEEPHRLGPKAARVVGEQVTLISPISCWEISMLAQRRRIQLDVDVYDWANRSLEIDGIRMLPLSQRVAIFAGSDALPLHGDPADRIIAATALIHELPLVTRDARLHALTAIETIW